MPGGFPLGLEICNQTTSAKTAVNGNASANVLGSWTQIIASTANDTCFMVVDLQGFGTNGPDALVDIGVGAAGSEKVIIQQLIVSFSEGFGNARASYLLPISIPAATAISARCQIDNVSDSLDIELTLFDGAFTMVEGYSGVDALGANAAASIGTQIDPGAVAQTKGAYVALTASTARNYAGLYIGFDAQGQTAGTGTGNTENFFFDIAIGASGSEKIIIPDIDIQKLYNLTIVGPMQNPMGPYFVPIPSGTKISARAACSNNTSPNRLMGVTAYGIYQ